VWVLQPNFFKLFLLFDLIIILHCYYNWLPFTVVDIIRYYEQYLKKYAFTMISSAQLTENCLTTNLGNFGPQTEEYIIQIGNSI
jgi:hypothetical protein